MARDPIVVQLDEPLEAHGEKITSLTLRAPTGKDILEAGFPYNVTRNSRTGEETSVVNGSAMRLLLSAMAQVPASTIDQLSAVEMTECFEAVRFFSYYRVRKVPSGSPSVAADGAATAALLSPSP